MRLLLPSLCLVPSRLGEVRKWAQEASPGPGGQAGSSCSPDLSKPTAAPSPGGTPLSPARQPHRHPAAAIQDHAAPPRGGPARFFLGPTAPALTFCLVGQRPLGE